MQRALGDWRLRYDKTNALRLITQAGIPHRTVSYDFDEHDLSGAKAAAAIGMPPEQVFKTLVARGDKTGVVVFCIPVLCTLDLKKAAKVSGNKKVEMVHMNELLPLTGYIRGGCSPIGMKRPTPPSSTRRRSSLTRSPSPPEPEASKFSSPLEISSIMYP